MAKYDPSKRKKNQMQESYAQSLANQQAKYSTLANDIINTNSLLEKAYSGWQSPEQLATARAGMEGIVGRLGAYGMHGVENPYASTLDNYNNILSNWDSIAQNYGQYANADAYNRAQTRSKLAQQHVGLSFDDVQKEMAKYQEGTAEHDFFKGYTDYRSLKDFDRALMSLQDGTAEKEKLQNARNLWHDENRWEDYSYLMNNNDFDLLSSVSEEMMSDPMYRMINTGDIGHKADFSNGIDLGLGDVRAADKARARYLQDNLDRMTPEEKKMYNYIRLKQGEKQANEYLDSIAVSVGKRVYDESQQNLRAMTDEGNAFDAAMMSIGATLMKPFGVAAGAADIVGRALTGREANPYSTGRIVNPLAQKTQGYISENIAEETPWAMIGDQNAFSFAYDTLNSMADSAIGGFTMGGAYAPVMGAMVYQQNLLDLKEKGVDDTKARTIALLNGLAETGAEYLPLHMLETHTGADGIKSFFMSVAKQAAAEGTEEIVTEFANQYIDYMSGHDSELRQMEQDMMDRGYSQEEAGKYIQNYVLKSMAWSFAGGALSGAGLGGIHSGVELYGNTKTGNEILQNGRAEDLFDIANSRASALKGEQKGKKKESRANLAETVARYREEGVDASTAKAAQLGNLYAATLREIDEVQHDKKSYGIDQMDAIADMQRIGELSTKKTTPTVENVAEDLTEDQTESIDRAVAELPSEVAEQIKASYDGKTDAELFSQAYQTVQNYGAKGYGIEYVLQNKSVLSDAIATKAYKEGAAAKVSAQQTALDAATKQYSGGIKAGKFNDAIIDYTGKDSSKINWNTLTKRQQFSINLVSRFSKVTGANIVLMQSSVEDGKRKGKNGIYDASSNTIYIDVYAGINDDTTDVLGEAILPTLSHEFTHWAEQKSPELYKKLTGIVFDGLYQYSGMDAKALIDKEIKRMQDVAKTDGRSTNISEEDAISEIVARACERMLVDGHYARDILSGMNDSERKDFVGKIKSIITNVLDWCNKMLAEYSKGRYSQQSAEAKALRAIRDKYSEALKTWEEMAKDATRANAAYDNLGQKIADLHDVQNHDRYVEKHIEEIDSLYSTSSEVDKEELLKRYKDTVKMWRDISDKLHSIFLDQWNNQEFTDRAFSVFKKQSGYKYNVELSAMCKKGVPLFEAIDHIVNNEILKKLGIKELGKAEKEMLYDIIKEHGFEIPCAICYVEQARQREGSIINDFVNGNDDGKLGWNQLLDMVEKRMAEKGVEYKFPSLSRSVSTDKYEPEKLTMDQATQTAFYESMLELCNEEIKRTNKEKGKDIPLLKSYSPAAVKEGLRGKKPINIRLFKALFESADARFKIDADLLYSSMTTKNLADWHNTLYLLFNMQGGVGGYKTKQRAVAYMGDIIKKKWGASATRKAGGIRNQSNSDFMMYLFLDQVQMYVDLTAKGFYLQAYTKSTDELKLFGLSGAKINASLIPKVVEYKTSDGTVDLDKTLETAGLDENGNLLFDDLEGINHNEAFMLIGDPNYSKNICGICIGYSDAHIMKMLDDPRIQMIIGYHDKTNDRSKRYRGARYAKNYNGLNETQRRKGTDENGNPTYETTHAFSFSDFLEQAEKCFKKDKSGTYTGTYDFAGKTYNASDIPMLAADMYLEKCREKSYLPAYNIPGIVDHPNYYKLLADFGLKDSEGNYAPHSKVAFNLPSQVPSLVNGNVTYEDTSSFVQRQLSKEMETRDAIASALADETSEGIIPQFAKRVEEARKNEEKYSDRNTPIEYTYDYLVSKEPMHVVSTNSVKTTDRNAIRKMALDNARSIGKVNKSGGIEVYVKDLDANVIVGRKGIDHGLDRRAQVQSESFSKLAEILSNSIKINESYPRREYLGNTYILVGASAQEDGISITTFVVNKYTNEIEDVYSLHSANSKKRPSAFLPRLTDNTVSSNGLFLSIDQLLDYVNELFPEVFSEDVYKRYGYAERPNPNSKIAESIKYSDRDSSGRTLTAEQQKYFADSKVRDKDGNLLVMYHGTKAEFTEFKKEFIGSTGAFEGTGFNFTPSKGRASSYSTGRVLEGYVNVAKPLSFEKKTFSVRSLASIIEKIDPTGDDIIANYARETRDYGSKAFVRRESLTAARAIYDFAYSDVDIYSELSASAGGSVSLMQEFENLGYDGLIHYNDDGSVKTVVTFNSNQFKNADNANPTKSADIRFSDRDTGYHAGDLGKAEPLSSQGYGRDTGHFGTGTYFVGDEKEISNGTYGSRPHEKVDFSKYKLYKVESDRIGYKLHNFLRGVDGFYDLGDNDIKTEEEWENRREKLSEVVDDYFYDETKGLSTDELIDECIALFGSYDFGRSLKDYLKTEDGNPIMYSDGDFYYWDGNDVVYIDKADLGKYGDMYEVADRLLSDNRYAPREISAIDRFTEAIENDSETLFGISPSKARSILKSVNESIASDKTDPSVADSAATRFMKALGYEGIDVRGTDLDNTTYGSVIYDLKGEDLARKNEIGTARFSDRDSETYDLLDQNKRLSKENAQLTEMVERLQERLELEKKVTGGKILNTEQIDAVARYIKKYANSNINSKELAAEIKAVYQFINEADHLDANDVYQKLYEVARHVASQQKGTVIVDDYAKKILSDIRAKRIKLNAEQLAEIKSAYGEHYKSGALRNLVYFSESGTELDHVWQELSAAYPEVFDANTNPADQVLALAEIAISTREAKETVQKYSESEMVKELAVELLNKYWTVNPIRTTSDKYQKQIAEMSRRNKEAVQKYKEEAKQQKLADDIHYGKVINKIRQQRDAARTGVRQKIKAHDERREQREMIKKITKDALTLNQWMNENSKDHHIPDYMKSVVAGLIKSIDFSSKRLLSDPTAPTKNDIRLSDALLNVKKMVADIDPNSDYVNLYIPDELRAFIGETVDKINKIAKDIKGDDEYVLNAMSLEELKDLYTVIKTLKASISKMNKFHSVTLKMTTAQAAHDVMDDLDSRSADVTKNGLQSGAKKVDWSLTIPVYAFDKFGETGKKMFKTLEDGWGKLAQNSRKVEEFARSVFTEKQAKKHNETIHEFDILDPASDETNPEYQTIRLTESQLMTIYCLAKRDQARQHMFGGGIVIGKFKDGRADVNQPEGIQISESELQKMLDIVEKNAEMKKIADSLQAFMNNECAKWGNEVTQTLYEIDGFGEKNYFPIKSNPNITGNGEVKDPYESSLYRLLNLSFTKKLNDNANNEILIESIYDVFASHTTDMAKYNALAIPVLDVTKWFNYRESSRVGETQKKEVSVKKSMERALGTDSIKYVSTFLKDLNGATNTSRETLSKTFFSRAKVAAVGANLRVVSLQPLSYIRASYLIDSKYLLKGMTMKADYKTLLDHCGIALWKDMGFFDVNIGRDMKERIVGKTKFSDKVVEKSMEGAGKADEWTIKRLWNACLAEGKDKGLSGESLNKYAGDRLTDIIYRTQVVDSTMTRCDLMRSSDGRDKSYTAFMSEPILSLNLLKGAYSDFAIDADKIGKANALKKDGRKVARAITTYTVCNIANAVVETLFSLLRDEEKDITDPEAFIEEYFENFLEDMSLLGKIPYLKDLISTIKGYATSGTDQQWMQGMRYLYQDINKIIAGKGNPYKTAKDSIREFSYFTGLPAFNAYRDVVSVLDEFQILDAEDLEEMFNSLFD